MDKNDALDVRQGDHRKIPFDTDFFDFAFMTDVIHHVPDLLSMFSELRRVIKSDGRLCVVTESHEQIEGRFYNCYFPSLAANEKSRYPDISNIVETAERVGFVVNETEILFPSSYAVIDKNFVKNVEEKNYSMFRLLDKKEFIKGLQKVKNDLGRAFERNNSGETLIWLKNNG